jgi:hypothetical protein
MDKASCHCAEPVSQAFGGGALQEAVATKAAGAFLCTASSGEIEKRRHPR